MPLITEMFAFVISDKSPEDEGIPAFEGPGGMAMPMVGADLTRIADLMPLAQDIADRSGKQVRIYRFSQKRMIGEVNPAKAP